MMNYKTIVLLVFAISFSKISWLQDIPDPQTPPRMVNDFTGLFSNSEAMQLEQKLQGFHNQTSNQIYIVTYNDLQGYPISEFGSLLGEKWKIGQKGKDNGILVLISPANRRVTIQVGYGLEGAVPDALAKRIIENEITPAFKQSNYYQGTLSAAETLMSLTKGEFTADEYMQRTKNKQGGSSFVFLLFLILVFVLLFGRSRGSRHHSVGRSLPFWLLLGAMSGRSSGGGFGGFSSGSGSFGGFGGGGGGSFGGGGASGGW